MDVILSAFEMSELLKQDPATKKNGGYQSLLVGLQNKLNQATGELNLTPTDIERIARYAFDYKTGGWETTLKNIFAAHLGPTLGR